MTVGALGFEQPNQGPDAEAGRRFQALARRLVDPDLGRDRRPTYAPSAYRGILSDGVDSRARPVATPAVAVDDVRAGRASSRRPTRSACRSPTRTLTAADVAALGIDDVEGGAESIALKTSDGKVYALALRPLLPDEKA